MLAGVSLTTAAVKYAKKHTGLWPSAQAQGEDGSVELSSLVETALLYVQTDIWQQSCCSFSNIIYITVKKFLLHVTGVSDVGPGDFRF